MARPSRRRRNGKAQDLTDRTAGDWNGLRSEERCWLRFFSCWKFIFDSLNRRVFRGFFVGIRVYFSSDSVMASLRGAVSKARSPEGNENDSDGVSDNFTLPPPRAPLISIPDPSQSPRGAPPGELEVPKADAVQLLTKWNGGTPRSGQSTPTRSTPRPQCGNGGLCSGNGGRFPLHSGARERLASSKTARAMVEFKACPSAEVRHFELDEDTSFWNDHNVQVQLSSFSCMIWLPICFLLVLLYR